MNRIALLSLTLAAAACGSEEPGRIPVTMDPVDVVVSQAQRAPSFETFPATVVSERTAEIATRLSGTIARVHADVGAAVRSGDPLVSLDADDIDARVHAAEAGFQLAERSFKRIENLAGDGAASAQELDQATAALESARAQVTEARAQKTYAVVRAPFDGIVVQRSVDAGDLASPGMPLMTLVAPGALKVVADLPAERVRSVHIGDAITVELPGVEGPLHASITQSVQALGGSSRTFRVEARLESGDSGALAGSYARIRLQKAGTGSMWIPADALIVRGQLKGVMSVEGDSIRLRWVRMGQERSGAIELLSGPQGALTVVRSPAPGLIDGTPVRNARTEAWTADLAIREELDARTLPGGIDR